MVGDASRQAILQMQIPELQRKAAASRLPGMQPVVGPWVQIDDGYDGQMHLKADLLKNHRRDVLAVTPEGQAACLEAFEVVIAALRQIQGFRRLVDDTIVCPDGRQVQLDPTEPLATLGALIQEDICLLQKKRDEHRLTAALLCFPASWTLREKIGRPLSAIHRPVAQYDKAMDERVGRLFDHVRVGQPMWRANLLNYDDPALYQPRAESDPRPIGTIDSLYERSERQTILRLPKTDAVLFAIHSVVVAR